MRHLQEWAASQLPLARMDLLNLRQPRPPPPTPHPPPPRVLTEAPALGGSVLSPFLCIQLPEASPGGPSCQGQELLWAVRLYSVAQISARESGTGSKAQTWLTKPNTHPPELPQLGS